MPRKSRFLFLIIPLLFASCSLLKVNLEGDSEPFSKRDLNTRLLVRAFHDEFTSSIIRAADSIRKSSDNLEIQQKAIEWKIIANKASSKAAFQSIPEITLVDSWVLTQQMEDYFNKGDGTNLFGHATAVATATSVQLQERMKNVAKTLYTQEKYEQLASFVSKYAGEHPFTSLEFPKKNLLRELTTHLKVADTTYFSTLGSSSQAMSDLSDRIGVFREQLQLQLEWQKELISLSWENDSIAGNYLARADSLSARLDKLAQIAKESPETMAAIAENMKMELLPVVYGFTDGIDGSIQQFGEERDELQKFIDAQRILAVADLNSSGKVLIDETGQSLEGVIKEVSWLLIVLAIVFALVFGGIPFFAGYLVAKARFKKKQE